MPKERSPVSAMPTPDSTGQYPLFGGPPQAAPAVDVVEASSSRHSSFVVYVDESGDHSLESVDPNYPVFVLAFCVFHKSHYAQKVVPAVEAFKFKHFGHDVVVLHETDIRKEKGEFRFNSRPHKDAFIDELNGIIEANNFILIGCVIDKRRLRERDRIPTTLRWASAWKPFMS